MTAKRKENDMSAGTIKVPTRFVNDTRFDVAIPAAPFRGAAEHKLDQFKDWLLKRAAVPSANPDLMTRYQYAATEAATLAWMTPYPLLVLPVLLEEKLASARLHAERQKQIRGKSECIMAEAA
jgi:hypothetical protein